MGDRSDGEKGGGVGIKLWAIDGEWLGGGAGRAFGVVGRAGIGDRRRRTGDQGVCKGDGRILDGERLRAVRRKDGDAGVERFEEVELEM